MGCANSGRVENRDYAFDTYYPTPNEIHLAQQRVQRYLQRNSQRYKNAIKYLAVYTTSIVQGDQSRLIFKIDELSDDYQLLSNLL
jgi:hypothetical protein